MKITFSRKCCIKLKYKKKLLEHDKNFSKENKNYWKKKQIDFKKDIRQKQDSLSKNYFNITKRN